MTLKKEISSTEKLLEVIRSKQLPHENERPSDSPQSSGGKIPSFFKTLTQQKRTYSIGIDIGYRHLFLVKVGKHSDNQWKLIDYRNVPLQTDISKSSSEFAGFIKRELDSFCGSIQNFNLWANMSSAGAEVASVRIPKVPKKQIENAVKWSARKVISFDEDTSVYDFKIQGEVVESGIPKLNVLVYAAPRRDVGDMRQLFDDIGYPLDGLTISPFGIQNLFATGWIPQEDQTVASLYVGRNWSRIDIFDHGILVMTRDIRAGINSMIQELMEGYNEDITGAFTAEKVSETEALTEGMLMQIDEARELVFGLSSDAPSDEELRSRFDLDKESMFQLIKPAVDRLIRQIDRTFRYYTNTQGNEKVTGIYVSSASNVDELLVEYIGHEMGIEHAVLDPLDPKNPFVENRTSEMAVSERASFSVALGVALSEKSRTPNFLLTYKEKKKQINITLVNRSIFLTLTAALLICVGILFMIGSESDKKKAALAQLERDYRHSIQVDENVVPVFLAKIEKDRSYIKAYSERYLGVAIISELSHLTPSNIRLLNVSARVDQKVSNGETVQKGWLTIEGIVSGNISTLEDSLVEYVLKLQGSLMFSQAKISKSSIESYERSKILRFTLTVKYA